MKNVFCTFVAAFFLASFAARAADVLPCSEADAPPCVISAGDLESLIIEHRRHPPLTADNLAEEVTKWPRTAPDEDYRLYNNGGALSITTPVAK